MSCPRGSYPNLSNTLNAVIGSLLPASILQPLGLFFNLLSRAAILKLLVVLVDSARVP